jgi:hypothetical protein
MADIESFRNSMNGESYKNIMAGKDLNYETHPYLDADLFRQQMDFIASHAKDSNMSLSRVNSDTINNNMYAKRAILSYYADMGAKKSKAVNSKYEDRMNVINILSGMTGRSRDDVVRNYDRYIESIVGRKMDDKSFLESINDGWKTATDQRDLANAVNALDEYDAKHGTDNSSYDPERLKLVTRITELQDDLNTRTNYTGTGLSKVGSTIGYFGMQTTKSFIDAALITASVALAAGLAVPTGGASLAIGGAMLGGAELAGLGSVLYGLGAGTASTLYGMFGVSLASVPTGAIEMIGLSPLLVKAWAASDTQKLETGLASLELMKYENLSFNQRRTIANAVGIINGAIEAMFPEPGSLGLEFGNKVTSSWVINMLRRKGLDIGREIGLAAVFEALPEGFQDMVQRYGDIYARHLNDGQRLPGFASAKEGVEMLGAFGDAFAESLGPMMLMQTISASAGAGLQRTANMITLSKTSELYEPRKINAKGSTTYVGTRETADAFGEANAPSELSEGLGIKIVKKGEEGDVLSTSAERVSEYTKEAMAAEEAAEDAKTEKLITAKDGSFTVVLKDGQKLEAPIMVRNRDGSFSMDKRSAMMMDLMAQLGIKEANVTVLSSIADLKIGWKNTNKNIDVLGGTDDFKRLVPNYNDFDSESNIFYFDTDDEAKMTVASMVENNPNIVTETKATKDGYIVTVREYQEGTKVFSSKDEAQKADATTAEDAFVTKEYIFKGDNQISTSKRGERTREYIRKQLEAELTQNNAFKGDKKTLRKTINAGMNGILVLSKATGKTAKDIIDSKVRINYVTEDEVNAQKKSQNWDGVLRGWQETVEDKNTGTTTYNIHLASDATAYTVLHEIGHVLRKMVPQEELFAFNKEYGFNLGEKLIGEDAIEAEERFADDFAKYMATAAAPNKQVESLFGKIKSFLSDILSKEKVSENIRAGFDRMFSKYKYEYTLSDRANFKGPEVAVAIDDINSIAKSADVHTEKANKENTFYYKTEEDASRAIRATVDDNFYSIASVDEVSKNKYKVTVKAKDGDSEKLVDFYYAVESERMAQSRNSETYTKARTTIKRQLDKNSDGVDASKVSSLAKSATYSSMLVSSATGIPLAELVRTDVRVHLATKHEIESVQNYQKLEKAPGSWISINEDGTYDIYFTEDSSTRDVVNAYGHILADVIPLNLFGDDENTTAVKSMTSDEFAQAFTDYVLSGYYTTAPQVSYITRGLKAQARSEGFDTDADSAGIVFFNYLMSIYDSEEALNNRGDSDVSYMSVLKNIGTTTNTDSTTEHEELDGNAPVNMSEEMKAQIEEAEAIAKAEEEAKPEIEAKRAERRAEIMEEVKKAMQDTEERDAKRAKAEAAAKARQDRIDAENRARELAEKKAETAAAIQPRFIKATKRGTIAKADKKIAKELNANNYMLSLEDIADIYGESSDEYQTAVFVYANFLKRALKSATGNTKSDKNKFLWKIKNEYAGEKATVTNLGSEEFIIEMASRAWDIAVTSKKFKNAETVRNNFIRDFANKKGVQKLVAASIAKIKDADGTKLSLALSEYPISQQFPEQVALLSGISAQSSDEKIEAVISDINNNTDTWIKLYTTVAQSKSDAEYTGYILMRDYDRANTFNAIEEQRKQEVEQRRKIAEEEREAKKAKDEAAALAKKEQQEREAQKKKQLELEDKAINEQIAKVKDEIKPYKADLAKKKETLKFANKDLDVARSQKKVDKAKADIETAKSEVKSAQEALDAKKKEISYKVEELESKLSKNAGIETAEPEAQNTPAQQPIFNDVKEDELNTYNKAAETPKKKNREVENVFADAEKNKKADGLIATAIADENTLIEAGVASGKEELALMTDAQILEKANEATVNELKDVRDADEAAKKILEQDKTKTSKRRKT